MAATLSLERVWQPLQHMASLLRDRLSRCIVLLSRLLPAAESILHSHFVCQRLARADKYHLVPCSMRRFATMAAALGGVAAMLKMKQPAHCASSSLFSAWRSPAADGKRAANAYFDSGPLATQRDFDVVIVGAGIVGLATAREILHRFPTKTICVVEKEGDVAAHQTGHNSGVIHAGMYYVPGTVMARVCVDGARLMYEYCDKHSIPYERCGKLIVATNESEYHWLETLLERGNKNGVEGLEIVDRKKIKEIEPNVEGYAALYSPNTGIVDYSLVTKSFANELISSGRGAIKLRFQVEEFTQEGDRVVIQGVEVGQKGPHRYVSGKHVITCAGLHADRVAERGGGKSQPTVVPFRGTYWQMKPEYNDLVKMNIYPVPSGGGIPVGVHFTPTVNEQRGHSIIVGPGACLAFDREGYSFFKFSLRDLWTIITHVGLWKFAFSNLRMSLGEMYRDLNKAAFMAEARKLIPSVTDDMVEESFAGVMVQVFDDSGKAANDFLFERNCLGNTTLHVRSAPSPACTASLAIAKHVVDVAAEDFKW